MNDKPTKEFYVKFLGEFSLYFSGQKVILTANPQGKTMQLIYYLLKAGAQGCEKKELVELVRPGETDNKKRLNNFRQQLHRMRELINSTEFPQGDYIIYRGGRYYFTLDYPLSADTEKLDGIIRQIRSRTGTEEEKQKLWKLYEEYCESYTGEFLSVLGGEEWVVMESAHYQKWYFTCLNQLSIRLKEQKKFERLLHFAASASQFHPYDEWQALQIECLMALGRRKEAEKVYAEASELFYKDLGVNSLERVMAKYPPPSNQVPLAQALEKMKEMLDEDEKEKTIGAYPCSYPSFMDIYRIRARMDETNKEQSLLLLCTLFAERGEWKEEEGKEQMELFKKVISEGTRAGDVYTQYSKNQYLVLLSGAGRANKNQMLSRLKSKWKKVGGRAKVEYSVDEVEQAQRLECPQKGA